MLKKIIRACYSAVNAYSAKTELKFTQVLERTMWFYGP